MSSLAEAPAMESVERTSASVRFTTRPGGAVVIGGDFNGLGIVRSLGRQGIPVCVIDD